MEKEFISKFVASNAKSLAECYLYRENNDVYPFALMAEGKVVGFLLLDEDVEKGEFMIWRMMIDATQQGMAHLLKNLGFVEHSFNPEYQEYVCHHHLRN